MKKIKNFQREGIFIISKKADSLCTFFSSIKYILFLFTGILLILGMLFNIDCLKSCAVAGALVFACFFICRRSYDRSPMILLALISLLGHFFLAFIFNFVFENFGSDSIDYHQEATRMKILLESGLSFGDIPIHKSLFTYIIAAIYFCFGANRVLATFIVSFFTILSGVVVHKTCVVASMDKKIGWFASLAIWFMPGFVFFTSDLLKDSFILFLTALTFYLFAVLVYEHCTKIKSLVIIILIILVIAINTTLRFYVFVPTLIGLGMSSLMMIMSYKKNRAILAAAFAILALLFVFLSQKYLSNWFGAGIGSLFEKINAIRESEFAYSSAGIKGFDISTMGKALVALPVLIGHYIFQPFPTMWIDAGSASYIKLLIPDMIAWYLTIPFFVIGCIYILKSKNWIGIAMFGFLITFLVINALIVGNVGAIYRYRMQFQEFAFVIAGIGFFTIYAKRKKNIEPENERVK